MDTERLKQLALFDGLSHRQLEQIARWADEVDVPAGYHLADEGEFAHQFFVIERGEADVTVDGEHVRYLGPGDFFGEIALVETQRRVASVKAASPMRLIVFHEQTFRSMVAEMPKVADRIRAVIPGRLEVAAHEE
jgi:CRP-like cAMP-binding protein